MIDIWLLSFPVVGGIVVGIGGAFSDSKWIRHWSSPIVASVLLIWIFVLGVFSISSATGAAMDWFMPPIAYLFALVLASMVVAVISCLIAIPLAAMARIVVSDFRAKPDSDV